jgi:hypothetical protein
MITKSAICPICCAELREGEELVAKYIARRGWWVIYHVKAGGSHTNISTCTCAKAGYQMKELGHG